MKEVGTTHKKLQIGFGHLGDKDINKNIQSFKKNSQVKGLRH